eukprot:6194766-Pleurochrysis_carterae.AAC.2
MMLDAAGGRSFCIGTGCWCRVSGRCGGSSRVGHGDATQCGRGDVSDPPCCVTWRCLEARSFPREVRALPI